MIPELPPPPTDVPDYLRYSRRYNNRSYPPQTKKIAPQIPAAIFHHSTPEEALRAAKRGARGKSGRYIGQMDSGRGFCVYELGVVVERHLIGEND